MVGFMNIGALVARMEMNLLNDVLTDVDAELATGMKSVSSDAASAAVGFSISATINALTQASTNATQGSALLQYAMSTLSSTQSVLQKMSSLAVQANSNSITDTQRQMADQEFQKLLAQVDTNANNTWFTTPLFAGGAGTISSTAIAGANSVAGNTNGFTAAVTAHGFVQGQVSNATVNSMGGNNYAVSVTVGNQVFQGEIELSATSQGNNFTLVSASNPLNSLTFTMGATGNTATVTNAAIFQTGLNSTFNLGSTTASPSSIFSTLAVAGGASGINLPTSGTSIATAGTYGLSYNATSASGGILTLTNGLQSWSQTITNTSLTNSSATTQEVTFGNGLALNITNSGANSFTFGNSFGDATAYAFEVAAPTSGGSTNFTFQIGQAATNTVTVNFTAAGSAALGLSGQNIATTTAAAAAQTAVQNAITAISNQIAILGGTNTQLGFIVDNLSASIQNETAAKSTFTDIDVAQELTNVQELTAKIKAAQSVFGQTLKQVSQLVSMLQSALQNM